ncbi:DnaD domain protein [Metabacillus fastidiosus]|uniref:DnaD domain-containing protein n=1 Tax=Metabacillus fastidiosus TaxID=1458 RepID=UPI002E1B98DA|nr:DnaD domain protein [Metabacillus fastidiosus]
MAKYRQVHVEFWQDGFVLDLTPEEKYFYIYLMTNSKTSQCGIYELPKRIIETETGYNRETVEKLLQRFVDYGKIKYNDKSKEIMIVNWVKYNAIRSPKVLACIKKELETVKNIEFIKDFIALCKQYEYPIDTLSIDYGEEEEKEQQQEKDAVIDAADFYQQNFGVLNSFIGECISQWENDLNTELVIESMKRALKNQKKWNYAEGILKEWANRNVKSIADVLALDREFEARGGRNGKDDPRSVGRVEKSSSDSITGGQVGRLRTRQGKVSVSKMSGPDGIY